MSDEATGGGDAAQIDNLFGDKPADTEQQPTDAQVELPEVYQEGRVPKAFYREDGNHDINGLSKSWHDTRQALAARDARIKELEQGQAELPGWDEYAKLMGWDAVREAAPNSFQEGTEAAGEALLRRMHQAGVPADKASEAIKGYFSDLDGLIGEVPSDADLRKAAVAHLGVQGTAMAADVSNWIKTQHTTQAFSDDELAVLGKMAQNGPALGLLWKLSRAGARSAAPPSEGGGVTTMTDPEQEKREALKQLGTLDTKDWQRNGAAYIARARAALAV